MEILNTWYSNKHIVGHRYFTVGAPVFELGAYKIYKQFDKCYLHTFKDVAISQLGEANKELIKQLVNNTRPQGKYSPSHFIYDRALENKARGLLIKKGINPSLNPEN